MRPVDLNYHIFALIGCFAPQAWHLRKVNLSSFSIFVSGLAHSLHRTNSMAYCLTLSFILLALIFAPIITEPFFLISPGVASSFRIYFSRCSLGLLNVSATCRKLVSMVLLPWICQ